MNSTNVKCQAQHMPCDISYNSRLISVVQPFRNLNFQ